MIWLTYNNMVKLTKIMKMNDFEDIKMLMTMNLMNFKCKHMMNCRSTL